MRERIRHRIRVERPPIETHPAESWVVLVTQVCPNTGRVGEYFTVLSHLVHQHIPRCWDLDTEEWVEAHKRVVPGVIVPARGPDHFKSLHAARERARQLARVLAGTLDPEFTEEKDPPSNPIP